MRSTPRCWNQGDTVLGMNPAHGGHLTHGSPVNFSGKLYNIVPYGIDATGHIDYVDLEKTSQRTQAENDYRWFLCIFRRGGLGENA